MSLSIGGVCASGGSCSVSESRMYARRSIDTPALLISERIRPNPRTGHTSDWLYDTNARNSPSVISPFTACVTPTQITVRI